MKKISLIIVLIPLFVVVALVSISFFPSYGSGDLGKNNLLKLILGKKSNQSGERITLMTTGDVMLGRSVNVRIQKEDNPKYPFNKVSDLFNSADITYINLENPFFDPCPETNTGMIFCAPTSSVAGLSSAGVDVVNLANNHTRNYGTAGYNSTISSLADEGISYSDSEKLAVKTVQGTRFGFLGFDLVSKNLADEYIRTKILNENKKADILVVSFHWGQEYSKGPSENQKRIARLVVDAGADLVIGHHPHVVQSIEVYKDVPIVYSLGNFVFDQLWSEETRKGLVGKFYFEGSELSDYEFIPIYINNSYQPEVVFLMSGFEKG